MIVIIDYGLGNLASIQNMLKRLGHASIISNKKEIINDATKLILPGVGAFDTGINNLHDTGCWDILNKKVLNDKVPVLGICLGMQLMTKSSEEGKLKGLGWIDAKTEKIIVSDRKKYKIPHMGWNFVLSSKPNSFLEEETDRFARFYFVHSYQVRLDNKADELFSTTFETPFCSAFLKDNIMGVQFHPEKSHCFGKYLLQNFIEKF